MVISGSYSVIHSYRSPAAAKPACDCGQQSCNCSGATGNADANSAANLDLVKQLDAMQKRDQEVRAHEAAHLAAAGGIAKGGATYTYERGPDGQMYAVGGEVQIDTSAIPGNPEATIRKAETIRRAALAPADPSAADQQAAASASQMAAKARAELAEKQAAKGAKRYDNIQQGQNEPETRISVAA